MTRGSRLSLVLMAAGPLAFYAIFVLLPLIQSLQISTWEWNGMGEPVFVGLDNYTRALNDPLFVGAFRNTAALARRGRHRAHRAGPAAGRPPGPPDARQPRLQVGLLHAHHTLAGGRRAGLDLDLPARLGPAQQRPDGTRTGGPHQAWLGDPSTSPGRGHRGLVLAADGPLADPLPGGPDDDAHGTSWRPPRSTAPAPGSSSAASSCPCCGRPPWWSSRWPSSTR